ncbi:hypothetical protein N7481_009858 [Penicillium waksmanii]|uniref:uncharacterized protein n=1 Tax=Penicillium waksmanii TaxID=69791 RepID=UPI002548C509|nr:uncharacterized protein N7481_009858 [Penicillium waksmanii]KAJ5976151.1 hypothetical protein N7481_009858 [Penicillium waksmanii]
MARSDDHLPPPVDEWVKKTIEKFQAGKDTFSGREIFEVDEYCSKISRDFQVPEPLYQAFIRDMAYHYAGDATKQSLSEGLLKEKSNPDVVKEHLKALDLDGALLRLRAAVKINQQKMIQLPYADSFPKILDQEWGTLRGSNRMLPSYPTIPHTGECDEHGQAKPAQISLRQDRTTTLTPAKIRTIMTENIGGLKKTHNEVFYASGYYRGYLKPAYIWTALEKDGMGNLYLSDAILNKHVPLWRIILAYKGNLKAFDQGRPPISNETTDKPCSMVKFENTTPKGSGQGDLTALVERMFLEFKEVKDELKELKGSTLSTTEVSSEPSTGGGKSTGINKTSAEQSCEEEYDDEEMNPNPHSKVPLPTNEQNGDDADLDAAEEETRDNGTNTGSPDPLSIDEQSANSAECGNTPLSQTHEGNLTENDDVPEEMTPDTGPKTGLAVKAGTNKRPNTGSLQASNKRARSNGNRGAVKNQGNRGSTQGQT